LERYIPELFELNGIIENNRSHKNESTLTHIISVREQLEQLLKDAPEKVKDL
jgi:hypothetical protein